MYIGKSLKRREDRRFLLGQVTFVGDVTMPDTTYAAYVRSPHARFLQNEPFYNPY